jgi:hypothetical protein
VSEVSTLVS